MKINLGCIVEGHGDVSALPVLLRRLIAEIGSEVQPTILRPFRIGRYSTAKVGELERAIQATVNRLESPRFILIVLDAEDDCPAEFGPKLLQQAQKCRSDIPIGVVIANREFEAWFLASLDSLRGHGRISASAVFEGDPESVRGAKEYLTGQMEGSRRYSESVDQAKFAAIFDIQTTRTRSPSFAKLWSEVERLLDSSIRSTGEQDNSS
jgi:hypothetical protein